MVNWVLGFAPSKNANPNLQWELGVSSDIGIDFDIFNRLRGSVEYFDRRSEDLLYTYTAPQPPFLYSSILVNLGIDQEYWYLRFLWMVM